MIKDDYLALQSLTQQNDTSTQWDRDFDFIMQSFYIGQMDDWFPNSVCLYFSVGGGCPYSQQFELPLLSKLTLT